MWVGTVVVPLGDADCGRAGSVAALALWLLATFAEDGRGRRLASEAELCSCGAERCDGPSRGCHLDFPQLSCSRSSGALCSRLQCSVRGVSQMLVSTPATRHARRKSVRDGAVSMLGSETAPPLRVGGCACSQPCGYRFAAHHARTEPITPKRLLYRAASSRRNPEKNTVAGTRSHRRPNSLIAAYYTTGTGTGTPFRRRGGHQTHFIPRHLEADGASPAQSDGARRVLGDTARGHAQRGFMGGGARARAASVLLIYMVTCCGLEWIASQRT